MLHSRNRTPSVLFVLLTICAVCASGCQSTLPQDTQRIRDRYDAELADLKAKYEKDQLACDSAPNPQACKADLSAAYSQQLQATWERENAEMDQALRNAYKRKPASSTN